MADNSIGAKVGVPVVTYSDLSAPVAGEVKAHAGASAPTGWFICNGAEYSQATYPDLFTSIGATYNTQIDPTTGAAWAAPTVGNFRVPDYRGVFLRGAGTPSGQAAVTLGGFQNQATAKNGLVNAASPISGTSGAMSANANHTHVQGDFGVGGGGAVIGSRADIYASDNSYRNTNIPTQSQNVDHTHTINGTAGAQSITGDSETRPQNKGVNYIIRVYNAATVAYGAGLATNVKSGLVDPYGGTGVVYSGNYSPVAVSIATSIVTTGNLTGLSGKYTRVGSIVTVTATCLANATAGGNASFRVTLPIASNLTATNDLIGLATTFFSAGNFAGRVYADTTNKQAIIDVQIGNVTGNDIHFTFQYEVK